MNVWSSMGKYSGIAYGAARAGADALLAQKMMMRVGVGATALVGGGMMAGSDNPIIAGAGVGVLGAGGLVGLNMTGMGEKAAGWIGTRGKFGRSFRNNGLGVGGYKGHGGGYARGQAWGDQTMTTMRKNFGNTLSN